MRRKQIEMRESIIRQMTILARETGAVNLAQGFSDEDAAPEIKALAMEAIRGECHQYTDVRGAPYLRQALAEKLRKHNRIEADPDKHIVVTCGATEGMMIAFETLLEAGDTVARVRDRVVARFPQLESSLPTLLYALNEEYVRESAEVPAGATLALIPPVSGG